MRPGLYQGARDSYSSIYFFVFLHKLLIIIVILDFFIQLRNILSDRNRLLDILLNDINEKNFIGDVGQVIPFAKKHNYSRSVNEIDGLDTSLNLDKTEAITLKKIWPEPDWIEMANDGIDIAVLAEICGVYHRISKKPKSSSYNQSEWDEWYSHVVEWLKLELECAYSLEDIERVKSEFNKRYPSNGSQRNIRWSAGASTPRSSYTPFGDSNNAFCYGSLLPLIGWPYTVDASKIPVVPIEFSRRSHPSSTYYKLAKKNPRSVTWDDSILPVKNEFPSFEDAAAALTTHLSDRFRVASKTSSHQQPVYVPRKRVDSHEHAMDGLSDVSANTLMSYFGFRGIQFGNSLTQSERQVYINNTHYSLRLLVQILGIPSKWIGAGSLGLAFGARGHGNASAHYEPGLHTINLTRYNGPGSIAHEIMHAFDSRMLSKWFPGSTDHLLSDSNCCRRSGSHLPEADLLRFKAFKSIVEACTKDNSLYLKNAKNISGQRGGRKYWQMPCELVARAFEAFIQQRLEDNGFNKQWLALGTRASDYSDNGMHPYPIGQDRDRIFDVMAKQLPVVFSSGSLTK